MRLTSLKIPILQAPIGSCAETRLVAAVSQAGGLGALALTWTAPDEARRKVLEVKEITDNPFQVNFVLAFEPHSLLAALEAGAPVVTFSWGLPGPLVGLARSFGADVGIQVSTAEGARRAFDDGADFVIVQGVEAGGHVQATQPLDAILPQVVSVAGGRPVVAAGGLATGRDVARVLQKGAAAAMLGTRFLATDESLAHPEYKRRLIDASDGDTALTVCFDLGWPYAAHRVLRNETLERWEAAGCPPSGRRPGEGDVVARMGGREVRRYEDTLPLEQMDGSVHQLCLYAGTGVGRFRTVPPAGELIADLWRESLGADSTAEPFPMNCLARRDSLH